MPLVSISGPAIEPVTLERAKNHLRVDDDFTDDDALIMAYLRACREYAEHLTQSHLIEQKWKYIIDSFPGPSLTGVPFGVVFSLPAHALLLPKFPVQSVDSINYIDLGGVSQTMPPGDYVATLASAPARITPRFGKIWPIPIPQMGAVSVSFTTGYGSSGSAVPEGIKQWILIRLDTYYNHRGSVAVLRTGKIEALPHIDTLLDPYKMVRY
jgi:uncharacterized phiE125 gp8 family phage protein